MPEMQEVFRMATQKVRPDPGFVDRQYENQRRQSRRRKAGALALVAVLVVAGVVIGISTLRSGDEGKVIPGSAPTPTATPVPSLHSGARGPGRMSSKRSIPTSMRRTESRWTFRMVMRVWRKGSVSKRSGESARWR